LAIPLLPEGSSPLAKKFMDTPLNILLLVIKNGWLVVKMYGERYTIGIGNSSAAYLLKEELFPSAEQVQQSFCQKSMNSDRRQLCTLCTLPTFT
jgi:hypothetical protein